jgi:hypothetical protein
LMKNIEVEKNYIVTLEIDKQKYKNPTDFL